MVSATRLTVVDTLTLVGVEPRPVRVECAVSGGLPGLRLVGLPDAAVREAGERVRAALQRSGFRWPAQRIVVNLAPADLPKGGAGFDLPLALGILVASGQVEPSRLDGLVVHGEVGLDGALRGVPGVLAVAVGARRLGARRLLVPRAGAEVTGAVDGLDVWPADDLAEAAALVAGSRPVRLLGPRAVPPDPDPSDVGDLADVRGQPVGRRAVEVAAAGGHHLLLVGPPGCGKSMLARRLVTVLPDLDHAAQLEVASVHGVAGGPCAVPSPRPPVRAPQSGITAAALVGGAGGAARPGELSLAHRGVLVLDELLETPRAVLDALRQPLEDGRVTIDRARVRVTLPARVQLVATTNPCPCGLLGHPRRACTCRPDRLANYRSRLSGPLMDRIDVHVVMRPVARARLSGPPDGEASDRVAVRVRTARERARARQGPVLNRDVARDTIVATASPAAQRLVGEGLEALGASARAHDRCLRVARTVADLAGDDVVGEDHVAEALALRLTGLPA